MVTETEAHIQVTDQIQEGSSESYNMLAITKINKNKVIKVGNEFKYEEVKEDKATLKAKEQDKTTKEDQRFKSTHAGDNN